MPTFLWFYVGGLTAALAVGFVFYFAVGAYCGPLLRNLFGDEGGYLWGRTFRIMLVTTALIGGLSTRWYGCSGYTDYSAVASSPKLMFQKSTEQVAEGTKYTTGFLLLAANLTVIVYAVLRRGRPPNTHGKRTTKDEEPRKGSPA